MSKTIAYSKGDDVYTTSHYPMVRNVTSHTADFHDLRTMSEALREHGQMGHALLFGSLKRQLIDESRAGMANKGVNHEWVCFDFDKIDYEPSLDGAIEALQDTLPQEVLDADIYIQLSPSCYSPRASKLSFHAFVLINPPVSTRVLKNWLTYLNFNNDRLAEQIDLTASGAALTFTLDRCIADPSRIIYIAPPRTVGFEHKLKETELFIEGTKRAITVPEHSISKDEENAKLYALREAAGFADGPLRTRTIGEHSVVVQSEAGLITDIKPSGSRYIRFNLNGGDSLAYYIDLDKPQLIGNFKGEPFLLTEQVDKALYKQLAKAAKSKPTIVSSKDGIEPLAFYATNHGSTIYVGQYNRGDDKLRLEPSSPVAALSWLAQHGVVTQGMLPHYDLTYDIKSDIRYEEGYPVINLYEQTVFIKQWGDAPRTLPFDKSLETLAEECPTIHATLSSVMAGNARAMRMFLNWLGFIFQNRVKAGTAWLLWGVEGSGKGLLLDNVLNKLFGEENTGQLMFSNLDGDFNSLLEGKLLINIDEAELSKSRDGDELMAKLRNWITEPTMVINTKHVRERSVPSFVNFIVFANSFRPLRISASDRRWHVAPRQEHRWFPTSNQVAILEQGEELPQLAEILGTLIVDEKLVRTPDENIERERLYESTHSLIDLCATAIVKGDSNFFFDARPSDTLVNTTKGSEDLPLSEYDDLLRAIRAGTFNILTFEDLYILFRIVTYEAKGFPESQTKQKTLFRRFGLSPQARPLMCNRRRAEVYGVPAPKWDEVKERFDDIAPIKQADNVRRLGDRNSSR